MVMENHSISIYYCTHCISPYWWH